MTNMQVCLTRWRILATVVLASGCGATLSPAMHAVPGPEPLGAPPDQARVVFVRPSSVAYESQFTLIDEHGYFLGDSSAGYRFSVFFAPGEHYVVAMTEGAETLKMTLSPGRTYFVEVRPKRGVWKPQVPLMAINRQSSLWSSIPHSLSHTEITLSDFAAGQARLCLQGSRAFETAQRGIQAYAGYPPEAKAAATLSPDDGQ